MGRPLTYSSPEEMQQAIEDYFQKMTDEKGIVTVSGLAYALGFESRQSIYDYKEKGEFSYIIKRAMLFVEMCYEQRVNGNNAAGPIFVLKNMGWTDKTQTEISGGLDLGKKPSWFDNGDKAA